jgi:hypothetical protein
LTFEERVCNVCEEKFMTLAKKVCKFF